MIVRTLSLSGSGRVTFLTLGLLLLIFISSMSSLGHGQALPSITSPSFQSDSIALTVYPNKNVGVGWNTTSTIPAGTIPQNISSLFPAGYAIQSSSSFSQQSNKVVQTSTVQYQLPVLPVSIVQSISFSASQTGLTGQGSLTIITNIPQSSTTVTFSASLTKVQVNASVQVYFLSSFSNGPLFFLANQTAFQNEWSSTFLNKTWTDRIASQIQNATKSNVTVTAFNGTLTHIDTRSAFFTIGFIAKPTQSTDDFVTVFEKVLASGGTPVPAGLDSIIRSALNLQTGESMTLIYTGGLTPTLVIQSTTTYVGDLDAQLNNIKSQFFRIILLSVPAGTAIPPSIIFLNSTYVTVSQMSTTNSLDLNRGTSQMSLKGLLLKPPTIGSNTNFTIPILFQGIGSFLTPKVNFTLVAGSNSTHTVKIIIPAGTPPPSSTTSNSATWTNLQNATMLSAVQFNVQRLPGQGSLLDLFLSPAGIAIEAIVAAAIAAGVIFYVRKRRAAPVPVSPSGPAATPGLGPSPAPPTP